MAERDGRDLAEVLLRKARGDEQAVGALLKEEDLPDEVVGFHAQQAVEKSLKAVVAALDIDYAFSHDLAYLGDLLGANQIERDQRPPNGFSTRTPA